MCVFRSGQLSVVCSIGETCTFFLWDLFFFFKFLNSSIFMSNNYPAHPRVLTASIHHCFLSLGLLEGHRDATNPHSDLWIMQSFQTCMSLNGGRKLQQLQRTYPETRRTCRFLTVQAQEWSPRCRTQWTSIALVTSPRLCCASRTTLVCLLGN